ncbi:MAG: DUF2868 domain-containing protein [Burkholderiales bacterium]|nr:DUF2868 domain-containing protein [Burkholderiales bacterium]
MNESEARSALLVRAYETVPPAQTGGHWSEDDRAWATQAALQSVGEHAGAAAFIGRRSQIAAERLCARDSGAKYVWRAMTWRPWIGWALALLAFAFGLAADAVGPARQINVLAPPLLVLLVWNLVVYAVLLLRAVTRRAGAAAPHPGPLSQLLARAAHAVASERRMEQLAPPLTAFASDWARASAGLTASRLARILHWAAAAFAGGALFGMYLRGIAFEYRAGWGSTFLDASAVHALLSVVLGPAAAISGIALPDVAGLAAIRAGVSPGENAARWIHLYAVTLALSVLLPRTLMALRNYLAERRMVNRFPLSLDEAYFQAIARAQHGVAAEIRVLPYSFHPNQQAALGLHTLMLQVFGPGSEVSVAPAVAFGAEDALDAALIPGAPVALVAALFSLTATPERENHGAFIDALAARLPPATPFAVLIDEAAFGQRFDQQGATDRRLQRRAAWQRMLAATGRVPVFVDLEGKDFTDAGRALRAAIDTAPARAAQG